MTISNNKTINKNIFKLVSKGLSMKPILLDNDTVYYKRVSYHSIKTNDVIVISIDRNIIIHRVIYKSDNFLITKGDNNLEADGKIYPNQIVGIVTHILRKGNLIDLDDLYKTRTSVFLYDIIRLTTFLKVKKSNYVILNGLPVQLFFGKFTLKDCYYGCDILIDLATLSNVKKKLTALGYKEKNSGFINQLDYLYLNRTRYSYVKFFDNIPYFMNIYLKISPTIVHISKFDLFYNNKMTDRFTQEVLNSRKKCRLQKNNLYMLSIGYQIIWLTINCFQYNYREINLLELINTIICKYQKSINWVEMAEVINKYELKGFVYPSFLLLQKKYHSPIDSKVLDLIMLDSSQSNYINRNIIPIDIFSQESCLSNRIRRFRNSYYLSSRSLYKKIIVLFHPFTLLVIVYVLYKYYLKHK